MPKRKIRKKSFFRPVHLQAILFLIIYNVLAKTIFFKSIISSNPYVNFFAPYMFGVIAGIVFLYLLHHEDFFHFIREVEDGEKKREKGFLKKYLRHGKILATLIITAIGGPIFGALTLRLILPTFKYKILLLAIGNVPSTLLAVGITKGLFFSLL